MKSAPTFHYPVRRLLMLRRARTARGGDSMNWIINRALKQGA